MSKAGKVNIIIAFLAVALLFTAGIGFAYWRLQSNGINRTISVMPSTNSVCYNASTNAKYTTIEKALQEAVSGQIVVLNPPTGDNYNDQTQKTNPQKATYTIKENCEIKAGVTLVVPTDQAHISGVTDSSTLDTYIKSMEEDGRDKGNAGYNVFATANEARYLRVTLEIAENVTLTNRGNLVVSGYLSGGTSNAGIVGQTAHSYSKISMGRFASIVQDGSNACTYCYGYISEKEADNLSSVQIDTGKLCVPFVIDDYRGFAFSWSLTDGAIDSKGVSPFNQFELRNIDVRTQIAYSASVLGKANVYVSYTTPSVAMNFPKTINLIGNTSDYFIQQTDKDYSSIDYDYDASSGTAKVRIYGGAKLNNIQFNIKAAGTLEVDLSTTHAYLPLSYRFDIELCKKSGQEEANFNIENQKIKLLPGAKLEVTEGCTLQANEIAIYSAFYDGAVGNGENGDNEYTGVKYPLKDGATVKVAATAHINAKKIAGTVYCDDASNITYSQANQITCYEAWCTKSSGKLSPAWTVRDYLEIREQLKIQPLASETKSKIFVGLNTFESSHSYLPSAIINSQDQSVNVEQFQAVLIYEDIGDYSLDFKKNIYKAYYGEKYYEKGQKLNYAQNHIVGFINSARQILSDNNGTNEFNAQSVTIECVTPMINDKVPLYVDKTIKLQANVVDITKVYNKTITWSSDDETIATVDQEGQVLGKQLGTTTIRAVCDGVEGVYSATVIPEEEIVQLNGIVIVCTEKGWRSDKKTSGNYNGSTGNNKQYTFTIETDPANAPYASIKWTSTASQPGRQYIENPNSKDEVINDKLEVTVHIGEGTGASDDEYKLVCEVTDFNGKTYTATFLLKHEADSLCLVEDTLVMLADGTQKKVEDLQAGDMLLAFNHVTGQYEASPMIVNLHWKDPAMWCAVIYVSFSDGSRLGIITEHALFDLDLNKYVYLSESTAKEFIGHRFANVNSVNGEIVSGEVTLTGVEVKEEYVRRFSPVSGDINVVTEGLLGFTEVINGEDRIHGAINIFEYEEGSMKYDEEKMQADIETYGLYTYDDFKDYMTEEEFNIFPWAYFKVAVGKGNLTWEDIIWNVKYIKNELS